MFACELLIFLLFIYREEYELDLGEKFEKTKSES